MTISSINPDQHIEELNRIAKYHAVHMAMVVLAIFTIVGELGILIVSYFIVPEVKNIFITTTAYSLIIISGLIIYFKQIRFILLSTVTLGVFLIKNWNIAYNLQQINPLSIIYSLIIILFFILLLFFLKNIYSYQKYCLFTPDPTLYAWLKSEIVSLNNLQSVSDKNVIQFHTNSNFSKKNRIAWSGRFYNQCIILVWGTTAKVINRGNLTIYKGHKYSFVIHFIFEDKKIRGVSDRTSYERYLEWEENHMQSNDDWRVPWA